MATILETNPKLRKRIKRSNRLTAIIEKNGFQVCQWAIFTNEKFPHSKYICKKEDFRQVIKVKNQ